MITFTCQQLLLTIVSFGDCCVSENLKKNYLLFDTCTYTEWQKKDKTYSPFLILRKKYHVEQVTEINIIII